MTGGYAYLPLPFLLRGRERREDPVAKALNKRELKKFRELLESKRKSVLDRARKTLTEDMALDPSDLPDEMDLASSEYLQSFEFRLRGREKYHLAKLVGDPDIISRGFVYMKSSKKLIEEARKKVLGILKDKNKNDAANTAYLKNKIRDELGQFIFQKTERRPMILPVVIEV